MNERQMAEALVVAVILVWSQPRATVGRYGGCQLNAEVVVWRPVPL
ncbi:MAG: hypothetical protein ACLR2G_00270 [Phascolarctobacterium faecium]